MAKKAEKEKQRRKTGQKKEPKPAPPSMTREQLEALRRKLQKKFH